MHLLPSVARFAVTVVAVGAGSRVIDVIIDKVQQAGSLKKFEISISQGRFAIEFYPPK